MLILMLLDYREKVAHAGNDAFTVVRVARRAHLANKDSPYTRPRSEVFSRYFNMAIYEDTVRCNNPKYIVAVPKREDAKPTVFQLKSFSCQCENTIAKQSTKDRRQPLCEFGRFGS